MNMSVYERRQYLSHLINENEKKSDAIDEQLDKNKNRGAKGTRTSTVSGDALKSKLKSGEIPNT
jgi:hypothetical protein